MHQLSATQTFVQEPSALGEGDGDRDNSANAGKIGARRCKKIEMDVDHVLQLNEQLHVEDEVI